MAYSSGFNPHPRISYAGAAPTGAASEAEYLEIGLAREVDPAEVLAGLSQALPEGLDVLSVVESPGGALADRLQASRWQLDVQAPADACRTAVAAFLAEESLSVSRMTKKGLREFDCRGAVESLTVLESGDATADATGTVTRLELVLRHTEPMVRPDDVLTGLQRVAGLAPRHAALLTRLAQGPWDPASGVVGDPLRLSGAGAADRLPRDAMCDTRCGWPATEPRASPTRRRSRRSASGSGTVGERSSPTATRPG